MKKIVLVLSLCGTLMLSGCASTDLSESNQDLVSEYAAYALLKYDSDYTDKLYTAGEIEKAKEQQTETTTISEVETASGISPTQETTPVTDKVDAISLSEALGLQGMTLTYQGNEITDTYPADTSEEDALFVMKATDGAKLLVLKFQLHNDTAQPIDVDLLSQKFNYIGTFNQNNKYVAQISLLMNAMNTYYGSLGANESQELILVFQVKESMNEDIQSIQLNIYNDTVNYTLSLK